MIPPLVSFLIALTVIMVLAKWELSVSMIIGAITLALLTEVNLNESILTTILDPTTLLIALSVALIPILGGVMQESGMMMEFIDNLNAPKRVSLIVAPAIFSLLPIPGGALMSAPLVNQIDPSLDKNFKVAINVWYRHALIIVYPISSAMIAVSEIANIPLYVAAATLIIPCIIMIVMGYLVLIRKVEKGKRNNAFNLKIVLRNFIPIILTVIIDSIGRFVISPLLNIENPEIFLIIGLILSIALAIILSGTELKTVGSAIKKMGIWKYPLLIFSMFLFLEIFQNSGIPELIGSANLSFIMFIFVSFFLGFATGRVSLPSLIIIPTFLSQFGLSVMPLLAFSLIYFSTFLGYVNTLLHPCYSYSLKFFDTTYKSTIKYLLIPSALCFIIILAVAIPYDLFYVSFL